MRLGLFEKITGHFENGLAVEKVPKRFWLALSVMDHLKRILNTTEGSVPANPAYGITPIPDLFDAVPENIDDYSHLLHVSITKNEPRLKNVTITNWAINNRCHIQCTLAGRLSDGQLVRYRITFSGMGNNQIEPFSE